MKSFLRRDRKTGRHQNFPDRERFVLRNRARANYSCFHQAILYAQRRRAARQLLKGVRFLWLR
jgi:hypothetical protein